MGLAERNLDVYERWSGSYEELSLEPAEQQLLGRYASRWGELRMLDLGIGTGRTTYTFAPLAGRYVGIDYSPAMVEAARRLVAPSESIEIEVGDARRLSATLDGPFDLVLFSFNGIGSVGPEDREVILAEVLEVLSPGGEFLFSSHSTKCLPLRPDPIRLNWRNPPKSAMRLARGARQRVQLRKVNQAIDLDRVEAEGRVAIHDGAHGFELEALYVDPARQVARLQELGYTDVRVIDRQGQEVSPQAPGSQPWVFYSCRRPAGG